MKDAKSAAGFAVLVVFLTMVSAVGHAQTDTSPPGISPPIVKERAPVDSFVPKYAEEIEFSASGVSGDGSSIVFRSKTNSLLSVTVSPGDRQAIGRYRPGDKVIATLLESRLLSISPRIERIETRALLTGIAIAAIFIVVTSVLLWWSGHSPLDILRGKDGRYSNSQFQATVWFGSLVFVYVTSFAVRWMASDGALVRGPDIPQNLIMLSGLSAISFVGAKTITESKIQKTMEKIEGSQVGRPPGPPHGAVITAAITRPAALRREAEHIVKPKAKPHFPQDLLCDDHGRPDFGDTQMFLITIIAVGSYIAQAVVWLGTMEQVSVTSLPDVSSTILATFGLGQGAYLIKKGVGNNSGE